MKLRRRPLRILLAVGGLIALGAFQNCELTAKVTTASSSAQGSAAQQAFFDYPYITKPSYYLDASILVADPSTNPTSVQIVAAARDLASGLTAPASYSITITDPTTGDALCAKQSGTVTPPITTISYDCGSGAALPSKLLLTFTVGSGATQQILKKQF